jgi:ribosome-associated protein
MQEIIINFEPVELYKILKFEGLAESGAQAKQIIADGLVKVNGEVETRKRRKMLKDDKINLAGQQFVLKLA